jgi:RNA polymerase sigma-70 factor (ECF subfamily)
LWRVKDALSESAVIPGAGPAIDQDVQVNVTPASPLRESRTFTADERRFEVLYRSHFASVTAYARRRFPARADDVVAETFLIAWRRLEQVPEDALPWLYGVARRVVADLLRSTRRQAAVAERLVEAGLTETAAPELPDGQLRRALAALSEEDRELILLVYWEDLEPARAAGALGCSRPAALTRLWRIRRRLRAELMSSSND